MNYIVEATTVPRDMPWTWPQQLPLLKKTMASMATNRPPTDFTNFCSTRHSHLLMLPVYESLPALYLYSTPTRVQDPHWQPAQASAAVWVQDASLEPHSWLLPPCTHLGIVPPTPCALAFCWPDTYPSPLLCVHLWQYLTATEVHVSNEGPQAAGGYKSGPIFCHRLAPLGSPATTLQMSTCTPPPPAQPLSPASTTGEHP